MAFTMTGVRREERTRLYLPDRTENAAVSPECPASPSAPEPPFLAFARDVQPQTALRAAITAAYRRPEEDCLPPLIAAATLPAEAAAQAQSMARDLVANLRAKARHGGVAALLQEYPLSAPEGVALMCLAEALLRIPDRATRDALIRDKIGAGNWHRPMGSSPSRFVNAARWGLLLTGKLTASHSEPGLSAALTRLLARSGAPVVRAGMHLAMRLLGAQFVSGQRIGEALAKSARTEARSFRHSYDMLGEAALTAEDAARYLRDYEQAVHAIGRAAQGRGIYEGPGISVKLSALHPRYARAQRARVMAELGPRLQRLASLARGYDIGFNLDAEEADRLDLSLDLLEMLCLDPVLAGWDGIGFAVQAYQKRAPFVLDFLIDLARRTKRRLMVRLVKGAYWDTEIKRAQVEGLEGFPVFTRKTHTDLSYLACARKMLGAADAIFPQFATHNAQTLAHLLAMAGENFNPRDYEFQCLHGMGEALYDEVVGPEKRNRPCRIYAPVGTHETLLAYLVRRLLENGANSSFVHQIGDPGIEVSALIADPVQAARGVSPLGTPHAQIALPRAMFGPERENSAGLDLANEQQIGALATALRAEASIFWRAEPMLAVETAGGPACPVRNPAELRDIVGSVREASPALVDAAFAYALEAAPVWQATPPAAHACVLRRAASLFEARRPELVGLLVREAGKSLPAAIGEVREAVDFLRYDAAQIAREFDNATHRPLGVVVAISPWNFPLSIFTGQIAAALAAGNVVLAKPAEETPLIAAAATRLLRQADIPPGALQLLPGDGALGAALVADARAQGVLFTGSTAVARAIQLQLAGRLDARGMPIPLVAETGGQNAMVVDSSALPEQAVADIIASAFDSAGQRCSALRILLVQEEIAPRLMTLLRGALVEWRTGRPDRLSTDMGPLISAQALEGVARHIAMMRQRGCAIFTPDFAATGLHGYFMAPAVIEIPSLDLLGGEVFGPVLHVLRYRREELAQRISQVNALGYALTFGLHSRIDATILAATSQIQAGNIYVNRSIIGAVVGTQPFGGHARSGTGPKAGGPLYLRRLLAACPSTHGLPTGPPRKAFQDFLAFLHAQNIDTAAFAAYGASAPDKTGMLLPGPVGEQNRYRLLPRGRVLCHADTQEAALRQIAASLATGNTALVQCAAALPVLQRLPTHLADHIQSAPEAARVDVALFDGDACALQDFMTVLATQTHAVVTVYPMREGDYPLECLMAEQSSSVNTAAVGGNANLMTTSE